MFILSSIPFNQKGPRETKGPYRHLQLV